MKVQTCGGERPLPRVTIGALKKGGREGGKEGKRVR